MSDFAADESNPFSEEGFDSPSASFVLNDPASVPLPDSHYPTEEEQPANEARQAQVEAEKERAEKQRRESVESERPPRDAIQVSGSVLSWSQRVRKLLAVEGQDLAVGVVGIGS